MANVRIRHGGRGVARWLLVGFAGTLVAAALSGCGPRDGGARSANRQTTIRVGVPPVADMAPFFVGIEKGFFEDVDLSVEHRLLPAGAGIVASVVSGENHFGFENTTSLVIGRSKGLPLRIVSYGALAGSNYAEGASSHLLVRRDGPVRTLDDLEGRTVGVPALRIVADLALNAALEKHGVDYTKVSYVEIPFPAAVAAIESGRVDAATVAEPFATIGLQAGLRSLLRPIIEVAPDFVHVAYFTTESVIEREPDIVDRFVRAIGRSLDYSAQHPDDVREAIRSYTDIPEGIVGTMKLSDFSPPRDYSTLRLTIDLAKKYGFIQRKPTLSELLYEP